MPRPRRLPLAVAAVALAATAAVAHGQAAGPERIDTAAVVLTPSDVAVRADGDLLVADTSGGRVVRVDAAGAVTEVAAGFTAPRGVAALPDGGLLVADTGANRIRRVTAAGAQTTVLGPGTDPSGAVRAPLNAPGGVAVATDGAILVADTGNHRIRRISPQGEVTTVAGTGTAGLSGDGGPATSAQLRSPARVVALPGGGMLIADTGNGRIRRVDVDGRIATIAGQLARPEGVAVRPSGAVLIADTGFSLVRELGLDGRLRTIAGTGTAGFSGDGGDASQAELAEPRAVATSGERILVADTGNGRIRAIAPSAPAGQEPPTPPPIDAADPEAPPGVAPPVIGERAVASTVRGTVRVRRPGARRFAPLDAASNLPLGTEVDARRGAAAVFFVTDARGRVALAIASTGRFVLRQPDRLDRGQRPGALALSERLRGCAPAQRAAIPLASAAGRKKAKRRLRVRAKGRIRTDGRYGSAIVRGTAWTIADRCAGPRPGTLVRVSEGVVAVTDRVRGGTVRVAAGERTLVRAPRR